MSADQARFGAVCITHREVFPEGKAVGGEDASKLKVGFMPPEGHRPVAGQM